MSWCRFSTICENGLESDLYIYDSNYGVEVLVATKRFENLEDAPKYPNVPMNEENFAEWLEVHRKRGEWKMEHQENLINIGLPYDDASYTFNNKEELLEKLDELKELGYNFPERVFDFAKEWEPEDE